jgi:hypothetical protein
MRPNRTHHQPAAADLTGSTTRRGYGWPHQRVRAYWARLVEAGQAFCAHCGGWIPPGTPWDLGHTDDRGSYTGPEHARRNRAKAARKRNALARQRAAAQWAVYQRW